MVTLSRNLNPRHQQGAVSLLIGLVLLSAITVIALLTAKTVAVEIQASANQVRTAQAVAAAQYAMDFGVSYFDGGGFDHDRDGVVDVLPVPDLVSAFDGRVTQGKVVFDPADGTRCVSAGGKADLKRGVLEATGFSDDGLASRTVSQCLTALPVLNAQLPPFALVTRGGVTLTGNSILINRYAPNTAHAGGKVMLATSQLKTYINALNSAQAAMTTPEKINPDSTINTQAVSSAGLGLGLDIWEQDLELATLTGEAFFGRFFSLPKAVVKQLAVSNNAFSDAPDGLDLSGGSGGLIWLEGTQSLSKGTLGSPDKPAILVVNGDLSVGGSVNFYGLLYVSGALHVTDGDPSLTGTAAVENSAAGSGTVAVSGAGSLSLVYWPDFGGDNSPVLPGTAAVVAGSWRDW